MRKSLFTSAVFVAALLAAPLASAQPLVQSQEGIALQNEIDQLQQQVQQLQSGGNNGGSALGGSAPPPPPVSQDSSGAPVAGGVVASLLTQVQQLQSQVQALNGKVDELQNEVDTQNAQTQKQIGDLNFRVTGSATPGAAPPPGTTPAATPDQSQPGQPQALTPAPSPPPTQAAPPAPAPVSSADPKTQLHNAVAAYGAKNYAASAALAASLVKNNPQAPEAYRAQYLVAQSYAASGRSQDAAIAFDNTYNMNRAGAYAPQSLLGLASSLQAIGANDEACSTLASLNSQFPTPPDGLQPRIEAVSKRAGCQ